VVPKFPHHDGECNTGTVSSCTFTRLCGIYRSIQRGWMMKGKTKESCADVNSTDLTTKDRKGVVRFRESYGPPAVFVRRTFFFRRCTTLVLHHRAPEYRQMMGTTQTTPPQQDRACRPVEERRWSALTILKGDEEAFCCEDDERSRRPALVTITESKSKGEGSTYMMLVDRRPESRSTVGCVRTQRTTMTTTAPL
jgi:hypothetical protein